MKTMRLVLICLFALLTIVNKLYSADNAEVNGLEGTTMVARSADTVAQSELDKFLVATDFQQIYKTVHTSWKTALSEDEKKHLIVKLLQCIPSQKTVKLTNISDMTVKSRVDAEIMKWNMEGMMLQQDVFVEGGLCAWAVEEMLHITLPTVTEGMTTNQLLSVQKDASYQVILAMTIPNEK